jgi:hypothetical protein
MDSNFLKNEPMQLLYVNENGLIDITTEATDYLNSLKKEKLCILSIIGPRNSGKSKLLNSFLKTDNNGFNISETKGLWIWGKPVELENNKKLLILDCQALENDDVSLRLFLICELLSTYIIYNTKGEINDNLINDFFKYLDVSKTINIYSQGNKKNTIINLSNYLPDLLWIMNEYENKEISSDNYLENIIKNNNLNLKNEISLTPLPKSSIRKIKTDSYAYGLEDTNNSKIVNKNHNEKIINLSSLNFGPVKYNLHLKNGKEMVVLPYLINKLCAVVKGFLFRKKYEDYLKTQLMDHTNELYFEFIILVKNYNLQN